MADLKLYDRVDIMNLCKCSKRGAQRIFRKIYNTIPAKKRKDEHKKFIPEYYVLEYFAVPSDTQGK